MNIAITCSIKPQNISAGEEEKYAEHDSPEAIMDLADAIKANNHNVSIIDVKNIDTTEQYLQSRRDRIDLIFNVAEGMEGINREALVPDICERLHIPYTAASPRTCINTLDKARTKQILQNYGIPTPRSQIFTTTIEQVLDVTNQKINLVKYPIIVKPTLEGSSIGIYNDSLVDNQQDLIRVVNRVLTQHNQPAIAEEFMPGREFTVGLIGYKNPFVLPIVEITFDHLPKGIHHFESKEVKWKYDNPAGGHDPLVCPAKISENLRIHIGTLARQTYLAFDCRDWARMDFRLDANDIPNVLDINALPGFVKDPLHNSRLPRAAYAAGWTYEKLIGEVINSARNRYNI